MSITTNGNGNGNGANAMLRQAQKKAKAAGSATPVSGVKESRITFQTAEGIELRGMPQRVTRFAVVFELYNPNAMPQFSEALTDFKIILQEQVIYSGRAVISKILDIGPKVLCEAMLDETQWTDLNLSLALQRGGEIAKEFKNFLKEWQKLYKVLPEFKVVIADMQTFFHDLRLWLDKVELRVQAFAEPLRTQLEKESVEDLAKPIVQSIDVFINQFESIAATLEDEAHPGHYAYLRRQLHPFILVSPFAQRAFNKPLGYAGDYEIVNMMIRSPFEGKTLFAKIINVWLLGQSPAQAHRNRIVHLERKLMEETLRVRDEGRAAKIFNLGCGPAAEVQGFLGRQHIHEYVEFTLVDFNSETLEHLRTILTGINRRLPEQASFRLLKKSVYQILKDSGKSLSLSSGEKYDYIYCAGLFDYLPQEVCRQMMNIFYGILAPGGLLLATNATEALNSSRPFRYSMEYILDWHLVYRDSRQFVDLANKLGNVDDVKIIAENTGTNLFLEVRKPKNA
jgi:extracellular factor (EF) 3-hydroxypalmitic acid methyl ester biosynthesis protein